MREELPEGWCDAPLLDCCEIIRGVSYAKGEAETQPKSGLISLLRANNIAEELVLRDLQYVPANRVNSQQMLRVGDVVVAMSSGSKAVVGKGAQLGVDWAGTFGAFCGVLRPASQIEPRYFGLFFRTHAYRHAISEASAGTNINNLKREYFEALSLPLPPLAEQHRIVAKVEALLARVSAARQRLAKVPAILKRFRQSLLAAACSGRLTADWREGHSDVEPAAKLLDRLVEERRAMWQARNGKRKYRPPDEMEPDELSEIPPTWVWANFDHCAWEITVGHVGPMKDRYAANGIAFLRSQNVRPLRFDPTGLVFIKPDFHAALRKSALYGGEILVTRSGANTGDCCVFPKVAGEANCADLVITRPLSGLLPAYGAIYVSSPDGQTRIGLRETGMAQPHFNIGAMRVKPFPLPPLAEQDEIVRRVEALFRLADAIEKRVASATARADKLTQAILAKAFRGELVPTEAELARAEGRDYEPAFALLERIRGERAQADGADGGKAVRPRAAGRRRKAGTDG